MHRLVLYFKHTPHKDRFVFGDRLIFYFFRKFFRKKRIGSIEKVFLNLCRGLDQLEINYKVNLPFKKIGPEDRIIVLGAGKHVLNGYNKSNSIVAGIGLVTHPSDWPDLFTKFPVKFYLQHSEWTAAIYNRFYGEESCEIWPAGIDTDYWQPTKTEKSQLLVYEKFLWNKEENRELILKPILHYLTDQNIDYEIITYGSYEIEDYKKALSKSYGMIFLCEHESQGLAYQEAMSMNVPILAWDQGFWLDPKRFEWGEDRPVKASSVPYFNEHCGQIFKTISEFKKQLPVFNEQAKLAEFSPRQYILDNLTLKKSAARMIEILNKVYK